MPNDAFGDYCTRSDEWGLGRLFLFAFLPIFMLTVDNCWSECFMLYNYFVIFNFDNRILWIMINDKSQFSFLSHVNKMNMLICTVLCSDDTDSCEFQWRALPRIKPLVSLLRRVNVVPFAAAVEPAVARGRRVQPPLHRGKSCLVFMYKGIFGVCLGSTFSWHASCGGCSGFLCRAFYVSKSI